MCQFPLSAHALVINDAHAGVCLTDPENFNEMSANIFHSFQIVQGHTAPRQGHTAAVADHFFYEDPFKFVDIYMTTENIFPPHQ